MRKASGRPSSRPGSTAQYLATFRSPSMNSVSIACYCFLCNLIMYYTFFKENKYIFVFTQIFFICVQLFVAFVYDCTMYCQKITMFIFLDYRVHITSVVWQPPA